MIQDPTSRRQTEAARNRVAMEALLLVYAVASTAILVRTMLIVLNVPRRVWIGQLVLKPFAIVTDPLERIPGFDARLVGNLTFIDLLLLAFVVLFPLGLAAVSTRR